MANPAARSDAGRQHGPDPETQSRAVSTRPVVLGNACHERCHVDLREVASLRKEDKPEARQQGPALPEGIIEQPDPVTECNCRGIHGPRVLRLERR